MPWQCSTCGLMVLADTAHACPSCGGHKTSWTVQAERTRTLVVGKKKKFECLRGRPLATTSGLEHLGIAWRPTRDAAVVAKADARAVASAGRLPAPDEVLCVRLFPEKQKRWDLTLTVNCAGRPAAEVALELEPAEAHLDEARSFDVLVVCVHGPEAATDVAFTTPSAPLLVVLDVTDDTPLGHAPTLDVAALKAKPTRLTLGPGGPLVGARLEAPFAARRSFPKPTALATLREVAARMAADPSLEALVVGHATSGPDDDANRALALRRAEATQALLTGDVAALRARFGSEGAPGDWSWAEVQWLLSFAKGFDDPCYVGLVDDNPGPATERALGTFQLHRDLPVTYDLDEPTLARLLQEYVDALGPTRPAAARVRALGAGPWHPPRPFGPAGSPEGGGALDPDRVELFLGAAPTSPPPEACADGPGACGAYASWCDRVLEELPPPVRLPMPMRVVDRFGAPAADRPLRLLDLDGAALLATTTSRTGFVAAEAPPGTYAIELQVGPRKERWAFRLDDDVGGFVGVLPYDIASQPPPPPRREPPGKTGPGFPVPNPGEGPLRLDALWVLPAPFADRPERPVDLVVPQGMQVVLRWEVENAAAVRLEALAVTGAAADVPTKGDEARHTPALTTAYTLTATGRDGGVTLKRWVNVVVVPAFPGPHDVQGEAEWLRVVRGAGGA